MRAFRDSLTIAASIAALGLAAFAKASPQTQAENPLFPLAIGNSWRYRCEVEGMAQPGKVLRIVARTVRDDGVFFKAELQVGQDPKPLVYFLSVGADGTVRQSTAAATEGAEVVIAADTTAGTRHGSWQSAGTERLHTPALPNVLAVRLENFSIESPDLPTSKRAEWLARFYVKGVGPVAEADGLGGHCELVSYRQAKSPGSR